METQTDRADNLSNDATLKRRRFRIVKLEERIAPGSGGNGSNATCGNAATCHHCSSASGSISGSSFSTSLSY